MLKMLEKRRVDYIVWDYYDGLDNIKNYVFQDEVIALPDQVDTIDVHILLSKRSPCAYKIAEFNDIFHKMRQEREIEKIIDNYLHKQSPKNKAN